MIFAHYERTPAQQKLAIYYKCSFFQGLREGTFAFIISVFVYITTESEMALGTFGLLNSGISFIAYYAVTKIVTKENRKKAIFIGGAALFASIFIIIFNFTYARLLIYAAVIAIAYPLILVPYLSMTYDVIGTGWKAAEMRIEYIVVREIFLNLGRILSVLIFIFAVSYSDPVRAIPVLLIFLGGGHLFYLFLSEMYGFRLLNEWPNRLFTSG